MNTQTSSESGSVQNALDHLRSVLVDGETLDAYAVQRRLFAWTHRRVLVAATSGRFIALSRGLIGGFDVKDIRWQDLTDVKLRVGVFGADLTLHTSAMTDLATEGTTRGLVTFRGLRQEQARQVYRLAQAQEQAWREKRRIRELEEMRARSGGVQISTPSTSAPPLPSSQPAGDPVARLRQAKELLDARLITDSEYEAIKARVINGV